MVCPDLVIEIISPDDSPLRCCRRSAIIRPQPFHIWIVDPYKRTLVVVDAAGIHRPAGMVLSTPLVGEIDFALLFQQLDEPSE